MERVELIAWVVMTPRAHACMGRRSRGHFHLPSSSGSRAISRGSLRSLNTSAVCSVSLSRLERDAELRLGILLGADQHEFGPFVIEELRRIDG